MERKCDYVVIQINRTKYVVCVAHRMPNALVSQSTDLFTHSLFGMWFDFRIHNRAGASKLKELHNHELRSKFLIDNLVACNSRVTYFEGTAVYCNSMRAIIGDCLLLSFRVLPLHRNQIKMLCLHIRSMTSPNQLPPQHIIL